MCFNKSGFSVAIRSGGGNCFVLQDRIVAVDRIRRVQNQHLSKHVKMKQTQPSLHAHQTIQKILNGGFTCITSAAHSEAGSQVTSLGAFSSTSNRAAISPVFGAAAAAMSVPLPPPPLPPPPGLLSSWEIMRTHFSQAFG